MVGAGWHRDSPHNLSTTHYNDYMIVLRTASSQRESDNDESSNNNDVDFVHKGNARFNLFSILNTAQDRE